MKALTIICVVVLLLQFAVIGLSFVTGEGDGPTDVDFAESAWVPAAVEFDRLLDPFRPRLTLPWKEEKSFRSRSPEAVNFKNGHEDRRVAKFKLTRGEGVSISYACGIRNVLGYECPQIICLCSPGPVSDWQDFPACEEFRPNGMCPADGDIGEIVVYSKTGTLVFSGLGNAGGTVRQR